jgi:hypothetical protein
MRTIREGGCLMQSLAGCGLLAALACGCMFVASLSFRMAMPEPLPPVTVEGDCPTQEVQAFVDGVEERLETVFAPLEEAFEGDRPLTDALQDTDIDALIAARDKMADRDVPACAEAILEAELDLMDDAIDILESVQNCLVESEGGGGTCLPRAMLRVSTSLPRHGRRLSEAYEELADEAGIILPEEIEFGGGQGGLKIEIDNDTDGFEINVP